MSTLLKASLLTALLAVSLSAHADAVSPTQTSTQASADSNSDAEIERLMTMFHVLEVIEIGVDQQKKSPELMQLPAEKRECVLEHLDSDKFYTEVKSFYREIFSDPKMRSDMIDFFSTSLGRKFLEVIFESVKTKSMDVSKSFTEEEQIEVGKFFLTPSGQIFIGSQPKIQASLGQATKNMAQVIVQECGPPTKS
ncbi:MAG: hypothetical protein ACREO1_06230 [Arenimonas sp.]